MESPSPSHPHSDQRALRQPCPRHEPLPPGLCGLLSPAGRLVLGGRVPFGVPALSLSAVTAVSVLLLHRGSPCWCLSGPQIPGRKVRTETDTEMHSGSEPRLYVLVPTRPMTRAEADPLLRWPSHHGERRCARGIQRLQTKHKGLPSHWSLPTAPRPLCTSAPTSVYFCASSYSIPNSCPLSQ